MGLICARGGSKGIPKKNIRNICGKPLIAWSIQLALKIPRISRVLVSTDSEEIAQIAKQYGAEVPFIRPDELAQDDSPEWMVWRHALDYLNQNDSEQVDGLVVLPPTAPCRNETDIENCLDEYEKADSDVIMTNTDAHRNPYYNMLKKDKEGYVSIAVPFPTTLVGRQKAPIVFDATTVAYVANPTFVLQNNKMFDGKVRSVYVPPERALDIDTLFDFRIAEFLLNESAGVQEP